MPERYKVFVYPPAHARLDSHVEFLARVSESAADRLYDEYADSLEFIAASPTACPPYMLPQKIDAELRYKLFGKRYRIVFEVAGHEIYVYDIQDCRQDFDNYLV